MTSFGKSGNINHIVSRGVACRPLVSRGNWKVGWKDLTWSSVEKEVGVCDFVGSGCDEPVDRCESLGLRILFILDDGNSL